jgi:CO/xanthine dehydrogenase Mo-binding subunit
MGSNGSYSMVVGGSALTLTAGKVIEKGRRLAGHLLEAAGADIEFADGRLAPLRRLKKSLAARGEDGVVAIVEREFDFD